MSNFKKLMLSAASSGAGPYFISTWEWGSVYDSSGAATNENGFTGFTFHTNREELGTQGRDIYVGVINPNGDFSGWDQVYPVSVSPYNGSQSLTPYSRSNSVFDNSDRYIFTCGANPDYVPSNYTVQWRGAIVGAFDFNNGIVSDEIATWSTFNNSPTRFNTHTFNIGDDGSAIFSTVLSNSGSNLGHYHFQKWNTVDDIYNAAGNNVYPYNNKEAYGGFQIGNGNNYSAGVGSSYWNSTNSNIVMGSGQSLVAQMTVNNSNGTAVGDWQTQAGGTGETNEYTCVYADNDYVYAAFPHLFNGNGTSALQEHYQLGHIVKINRSNGTKNYSKYFYNNEYFNIGSFNFKRLRILDIAENENGDIVFAFCDGAGNNYYYNQNPSDYSNQYMGNRLGVGTMTKAGTLSHVTLFRGVGLVSTEGISCRINSAANAVVFAGFDHYYSGFNSGPTVLRLPLDASLEGTSGIFNGNEYYIEDGTSGYTLTNSGRTFYTSTNTTTKNAQVSTSNPTSANAPDNFVEYATNNNANTNTNLKVQEDY